MVPAVFAAAPQAGARPDHVADRDFLATTRPGERVANSKYTIRCSRRRSRPCSATATSVRRAAARFFRRGGDLVVAARGADGRTGAHSQPRLRHPAAAAGLLPQEGGRLQAFTIAWDTTRKTWFLAHTDGPVPRATTCTGAVATRTGT